MLILSFNFGATLAAVAVDVEESAANADALANAAMTASDFTPQLRALFVFIKIDPLVISQYGHGLY